MSKNIEELKKKAKWRGALYEVTRDINSSLSLKECLRIITEKVTQLLNVKIVSLMLLDEKHKELRIENAIGLSGKIVKTTRIRVGKDICVCAWVAEKGRPLLINDIKKDGRFPLRNLRRYHTSSLLSVPLKVKGRVIGVLNVNNKVQRGLFTNDDLKLLSTFADAAAIAIDNSMLFEELMRANKKLMDTNQLKSKFLDSLSHRLRTPLITSKYFTSILRDELNSGLSDRQREYLVTVEDNITRLDRLVDNLLDLTKIESSKLILNRRVVDIVNLIEREVTLIDISAREKNITIRTLFSSRLPKVFIDEERISEVFNILLDNALKFTQSAGKITIQIRKRDESVEVKVQDTGLGIAKRDLNRLFVRFTQLKPAVQKGIRGSGLGLAIAREIIQLHKGRIWAESQLGKGSSFIFTLPLYKPLEFLIEQLVGKIKEAEDNRSLLSLVILRIENFNGIKRRLGGGESRRLLEDSEKIVKDEVRRPEDEVMIAKDGCLVVFCNADKAGGYALGKRLKKVLIKHKFPTKKGAINLAIDLDVLTYPEDSQNEEELIRKARSLITRSQDGKKE